MTRSSPPRFPFRSALIATGSAFLLILGFAACERHPVGEPALWYGHGSGKQASKGLDVHRPDGKGARFSDTQGTEIAPVEEGREGHKADTHEHAGTPTTHENPNRHETENGVKQH